MYTIILFYIIGYLFFAYTAYKEFRWDIEIIFIIPLFNSLLFALFGLIIAVVMPIKYETSSWDSNIVTLKDNNSVEGNFFLGTGVINGSMRYVFYKINDDSTYQMWQVNYYDAKIRYVNTQPKVIITDKRPSKSLFNKFAIDISDESYQTYMFEVPNGSIKNSFELDAQ